MRFVTFEVIFPNYVKSAKEEEKVANLTGKFR